MSQPTQSKLRRRLAVVAASAVLALVVSTALWQASRSRCWTLTGAVTCRVDTAAPLVALTFDDGPTSGGVAAILPVLSRHGVQATFFLTGREATLHPELVRLIVSQGHEVANHSFTHQRMVLRSDHFYASEIARTQAALTHAGATSRLFRPPYGKKLFGLPRAAEAAGLRMVMWDVEDPQTDDPAAFAGAIVREARPGSIILIHAMYQGNAVARSALPLILDGLNSKGLRVVSAGELLRTSGPGPS